jgi:hypothetical protein
MEPLMKIVHKAITIAFNEGYKAGSTNPFKWVVKNGDLIIGPYF